MLWGDDVVDLGHPLSGRQQNDLTAAASSIVSTSKNQHGWSFTIHATIAKVLGPVQWT